MARRIDVNAPSEVEVLLRFAADDGGEMEHTVCSTLEGGRDQRRVCEVARQYRHARIVELGRHDVDQQELRDRLGTTVPADQLAASEQFAGEPASEKAGAAGDDHAHERPFPSSRANYDSVIAVRSDSDAGWPTHTRTRRRS